MAIFAGLGGFAGPSVALEPLTPPGNTKGVCEAMLPVLKSATRLKDGAGSSGYFDALIALGFSVETRLTVDADDLDPLWSAGETVPVAGQEPLRAALTAFARKYRCKIVSFE